MRKISILSMSMLLVVLLFVSIFKISAQTENNQIHKSLFIHLNEDKSVKRIEAAFTRNLTLDSLVQIKKDLFAKGITLHYKKLEFDNHNMLLSLACLVICNDGYSGSFEIESLEKNNRRFGFYRDYSPNAESPFGTGGLDSE